MTRHNAEETTSNGKLSRDTFKLNSGLALGFAEYGSPSGIPVIAFHGMPGSRLMMRVGDQAASAAGARIIAPERPGYGLSEPAKTGLVEHASDAVTLADSLGVKKFAVMGVSGGGPFALACAYRFPERVTFAAMVSGVGQLALPGSIREMETGQRAIFQLGRYLPGVSGFLIARMIKSALPMMDKHVQQGTSPSPDITPEAFAVVAADQREAVRTGSKGIASDMKSLWRPWKFRLEEIKPKVLLWHGEADNPAMAHYTADHLPGCEAVFYPGEGHTGPLTNHLHDIFAKIVNTFIKFTEEEENGSASG